MEAGGEVWNWIGHEVQVGLDAGDSKEVNEITGYLITWDPICKCLLLAKIKNQSSIQSVQWIPSCSVKSMKLVERQNSDLQAKITSIIENYLSDNTTICTESEETILTRGQRIVRYLMSHHLDVIENSDGAFIIDGTVRLEKPYRDNNFYCDIPLVLKRIRKLVEELDKA